MCGCAWLAMTMRRSFRPPMPAALAWLARLCQVGGADLREVYLRLSTSPRTLLSLGRMLVPEADRLRLDGLRFAGRLGEHWELAGLVGGYSNPFSRSLLTDYVPPCGAGVASGSQ